LYASVLPDALVPQCQTIKKGGTIPISLFVFLLFNVNVDCNYDDVLIAMTIDKYKQLGFDNYFI
jgi:hypothetical protein